MAGETCHPGGPHVISARYRSKPMLVGPCLHASSPVLATVCTCLAVSEVIYRVPFPTHTPSRCWRACMRLAVICSSGDELAGSRPVVLATSPPSRPRNVSRPGSRLRWNRQPFPSLLIPYGLPSWLVDATQDSDCPATAHTGYGERCVTGRKCSIPTNQPFVKASKAYAPP